jgi:hypothetical protein
MANDTGIAVAIRNRLASRNISTLTATNSHASFAAARSTLA